MSLQARCAAAMMLGLNFSHREALRLGIDPDEALLAILIHLKPALLRLSLYWDEISPAPGAYDFERVHATLGRAQQHDCSVLLTIGFKPQRHPAFNPPAWLKQASPDRLSANSLMMLERAVALLADYDAIDAWEVEHLPFLPVRRQPRGWAIGRALLQREIGVLREVDSRHRPVVASHPGGRLLQGGWREALVMADILGCTLSVPVRARGAGLRLQRAAAARARFWQLSLQSRLATSFGHPLWVTELSCESPESAQPGADAADLARSIELANRGGAARVYLLGAEEWLLMRNRGRPQRWESAQTLLRPSS